MLFPKEAMREFSKRTFDPKYHQGRWVNYDEAELLREWVRAVNPDVVLESGTANGYSTTWLASGMLGDSKLYTFDPVDRPKVWDEFTSPEVVGRINFCKAEFRHLGQFVNPTPAARILAFIDGDHGRDSVMEDFKSLQPYLKPGDVLLFHDLRERSLIKGFDDIKRLTPTSRWFKFRTARVIGVLIYESQTLPICDESKEPLVIHMPGEIAGPDKVRDTKWANELKPWAEYEKRALHTTPECHLLYETARRLGPGNYANLGVFRGMSVNCLAHGLKSTNSEGCIYAVDDYELTDLLTGYPQIMLDEFKKMGIDRYIKICKGKTTPGFPLEFKIVPFRFVFIDAGHRYEDIKADFEQWTPLLEADGEVGIHDCEYSNIHKFIEEDVLPKWELVDHVWRTKIFRRK